MPPRDFTDPTQQGIFDESAALHHLHNQQLRQHPDYLILERSCEVCLTPKQCLVPWAEVYCLAHGIPPHKIGEAIGRGDVFPTVWTFLPKGKCYHPNYRCDCSGQPLVVFALTPNECSNRIRTAKNNGLISPQQQQTIVQIKPVVDAIMARGRRG